MSSSPPMIFLGAPIMILLMGRLMGRGWKAHNPYDQPRPIMDGQCRLPPPTRNTPPTNLPLFLLKWRRRLQTSQARSFFRPFSNRPPFIASGVDKVCVFRRDMATSSRSEEDVKQWLQELQKQLVKKQAFEQAVSEIRALVLDVYPSSSPSLRKLFYSVICRVATVLQARYTSPGFWLAGLRLFEDSERLVAGTKEKEHLKACIARVHEHMGEAENEGLDSASNNIGSGNRYFFEGHLTMEPEPPPPAWLVAQNLLTTFAAAQGNLGTTEASHNVGSNDGSNSTSIPSASSEMLEHLISSMQEHSGFQDLDSVLEASLQEIGAGPKMPPPASKEVVANLPVITVTDEVLARLGSETECAVCRETLVVNDKMQELPCKHLYHPPCLKPWLDEHNSCPVCRHELQTDDHAYESWKEREKEAEEERKGAANAVRGGEHMYI